MSRLFLDTGILVAAINPRDALHDDASAILDRIAAREWRSVHTSDFVLAESLNFISRKLRDPRAVDALHAHVFGEEGIAPVVTSVLRVHAARFAVALEKFRRHVDGGLSFTDWTNLVVMGDERISTIATFDAGFAGQARVVGRAERR